MPKQLKLTENYEIIGHIGRGGMADVYKARQSSLDRVVAIKELKSSFLSSEEMVERFEREGRTASRLIHENIAQVYQLGRTDRNMFIVMEYVDGVDVKTIIQRNGCIDHRMALLIILGAARALSFAHPRGLIHRDIKPGNIMISKTGDVKLMDFGIVREIDSELTHTGAFLGTPSYMSPEQFRGEKITASSDLFSLGVVFYEALTGQKPFKADDDTSLSKKVQAVRETAPRSLNPEIPWRIQRVVRKLLAKKPEKRFGSAQELAYGLEGLMTSEERNTGAELLAEYLVSSGALEESDDATVRVDSKSAQVKLEKKAPGKRKKKKEEPKPESPAKTSKKTEYADDEKSEAENGIKLGFNWLWGMVLFLLLLLGAGVSVGIIKNMDKLGRLKKSMDSFIEKVMPSDEKQDKT